MARSTILCLFIICFAFLSGCDNSTGPRVCPGLAEPAIVVEVTDHITGRYIAKDVKGVITDGTFSDSLRHYGITQTVPTLIVRSLAAGFERPGTYDINIELEGYESYLREDIVVPEGDCGPETQMLQARLRKTE